MKILHRIGMRITETQRRELESLGVSIAKLIMMPCGDPLLALDISEEHPNWPTLRERFREWRASDVVGTEFSENEIESAAWLALQVDCHHGYPQPDEGHFGYRKATYDLSSYCPECGEGLRQVRPFQMSGEPAWGRNGILQLNWVFGEFFARPEVWMGILKGHGIAARPVLGADGAELNTVVQLVVENEVDISTSGLVEQKCGRCGRTKYRPVSRGALPKLMSKPDAQVVRTSAYFGSGASAHKLVLVSGDIRAALRRNEVCGVSFRPVANR